MNEFTAKKWIKNPLEF